MDTKQLNLLNRLHFLVGFHLLITQFHLLLDLMDKYEQMINNIGNMSAMKDLSTNTIPLPNGRCSKAVATGICDHCLGSGEHDEYETPGDTFRGYAPGIFHNRFSSGSCNYYCG